MPAGTPLPVQLKIRSLHAAGKSIGEIAKELGKHRTTVARYTQEMDRSIEVFKAPAASFDKGQVEMLQRFLVEGGIADIDLLSQELESVKQHVGELQRGEIAWLRQEVTALRQVAASTHNVAIPALRKEIEALRQTGGNQVQEIVRLWRETKDLLAAVQVFAATFLPDEVVRLKAVVRRFRVGHCDQCGAVGVWLGSHLAEPCHAMLSSDTPCSGIVSNALV